MQTRTTFVLLLLLLPRLLRTTCVQCVHSANEWRRCPSTRPEPPTTLPARDGNAARQPRWRRRGRILPKPGAPFCFFGFCISPPSSQVCRALFIIKKNVKIGCFAQQRCDVWLACCTVCWGDLVRIHSCKVYVVQKELMAVQWRALCVACWLVRNQRIKSASQSHLREFPCKCFFSSFKKQNQERNDWFGGFMFNLHQSRWRTSKAKLLCHEVW